MCTCQKIDKPEIIVNDMNNHLSAIDRQTRQKTSKDLDELNSTINQQDLISVYRKLHQKSAENTFSLSACESCTKSDCVLGYNTNFNKFKFKQVMQCVFSDHNGINLKVNNRKITEKFRLLGN